MRAHLDPEDVDQIAKRVVELLRQEGITPLASLLTPQDGWMDSRQAATYLGMSMAALHQLTAARKVPFSQSEPHAKCWFKRGELDEWRRNGS